jgi:surfeit locus 1 family protein
MVNRRHVLLWAFAIALIWCFCALGSWQLRRGAEKQAMLDAAGAVLRDRRALPLAQAQGRNLRGYDWVATHGRLLPSPVLLLDNQRRGEAVGVRVFGVLRPREGHLQLVDLGWLPVPGNRQMPEPKLPQGELALRGLMAAPPGAGLALGPAATPLAPQGAQSRWLATRIDADWLAANLKLPGLDARVLRLDPALPVGYARDLELLPNTLPPERHRGYALQWFGLAFATLCASLFASLRPPPK